ncbi:MAG: glycosyltransferase family 9 protein [Betaproteobacteria bacterium]|nr:glycosyltransferase family 9 protein [Betaproteobacteria bacterium]
MSPSNPQAPKILLIRRDNIGDLVCTTPLISALRLRYPRAHIAALVNTYNRQALEGHPDVDAVYAYAKAKHRLPGQSRAAIYRDKLLLLLKLRAQRFDYVLLAAPHPGASALLLARWIAPAHIAGYAEPTGSVDLTLPHSTEDALHEVEQVFRLAKLFGIESAPGKLSMAVDAAARERVSAALRPRDPVRKLIALHISARKPSQRWPAERFAELMHALGQEADFLLLWSPGAADHPQHPGDDAKAQAIMDAAGSLPLLAYPTQELKDLAAALSLADTVICSDGGAMHIAAALGKPVLCFFGDSDAGRWHPWGVPYRLLQPESRNAADISLAAALQALRELRLES